MARVQNAEVVVPVIVGTVARHLGPQATEYKTHQWTVYVKGADGQDISHVVPKVTFKLHPSFAQPVRPIEGPVYELTEVGWGEFDIIVVLHFSPDSGEKEIELLHRLKLYADDDPAGTKTDPVTSEQCEELVFSQPQQAFYQRVAAHQPRPRPPLTCDPYVDPTQVPNEQRDLAVITDARRKVAIMTAQLRLQLQQSATDSPTAMSMGGSGHM